MLASGYWIPDGIAVIGEGEFLFADRGGTLYHYEDGAVARVQGLPPSRTSGVYGGLLDKFNFGAAFAKGLTLKMGQTHVHRYLAPLLATIRRGDIDPTFVITHRVSLDEAPEAYRRFNEDKDRYIKFVLAP